MKGFSLLFLVFVIMGCNDTINTHNELIDFIQKNKSEFVKTRQFKQLEVSVKCIPKEFLKDNMSVKIADPGLTFVFSLEGNEKDFLKKYSGSFNEYRQLKWYLTNEWDEFIYLEQNGMKISPALAQFEERYELGKGCVFNVVFNTDKIDKNTKGTFVFDDQIFGMGKLKFLYDLPMIMNIPVSEKLML